VVMSAMRVSKASRFI